MRSKMCDSRASAFVALPWQGGRKEGRKKEEQDAADLQSFSRTNTAAAADWLESQIAHLPDQWWVSVCRIAMRTKNRGKPNCNRWKYRKQEVDERNKITESAGMPEEEVHQPEEWKHFCVEENIIWWERGAARIDWSRYSSGAGACCMHHSGVVVVVVATTIEDDDHGSKVPTDWQWHMDLHMASCCDHRSLLLYKCCGGSSQGFDDDPAYIGMLVVVITQIRCCASAAVKVLMILHMLVVVITDLLLLYKWQSSRFDWLSVFACVSACLHICTLPTTPSAIMLLQPRGTQIGTPHECSSWLYSTTGKNTWNDTEENEICCNRMRAKKLTPNFFILLGDCDFGNWRFVRTQSACLAIFNHLQLSWSSRRRRRILH